MTRIMFSPPLWVQHVILKCIRHFSSVLLRMPELSRQTFMHCVTPSQQGRWNPVWTSKFYRRYSATRRHRLRSISMLTLFRIIRKTVWRKCGATIKAASVQIIAQLTPTQRLHKIWQSAFDTNALVSKPKLTCVLMVKYLRKI